MTPDALSGWVRAAVRALDADVDDDSDTTRWRAGPYRLVIHTRRGSPWAPALRSLIPLRDGDDTDTDTDTMTVHATTVEHLSSLAAPPPLAVDDARTRSLVASLQDTPCRLVWDLDNGQVTGMDLDSGTGFVAAAGEPPEWELAQPFRMHLHWAAARDGAALIHAGSIGSATGGVLVLGHNGAGKSTTTLAGVAAGLSTCGDDYVHVAATRDAWRATPVYGTVKTKNGARLSAAGALDGSATWPTASGAKYVHHLIGARPRAFAAAMALVGVVVVRQPVPEETPGTTAVTGATAALAAAPTTLRQSPYEEESSMRLIAAMTSALPCVELRLPPDFGATGRAVAALVDELTGAGTAAVRSR